MPGVKDSSETRLRLPRRFSLSGNSMWISRQRGKVFGITFAIAVVLTVVSVWPSRTQTDMAEISRVKAGWSSEDVMALLGKPHGTRALVMTNGVYGVPGDVKQKVGYGERFEVWYYERNRPEKEVSYEIWFVPDSAHLTDGINVVQVTHTIVRHTLWDRLIMKTARVLNLRI